MIPQAGIKANEQSFKEGQYDDTGSTKDSR
jgi:hypothetical protein